MQQDLPTVSLEAMQEEQEERATYHQRLEALQRGRNLIPQMLATTAHYREESGSIRKALARMSAAHREVRP